MIKKDDKFMNEMRTRFELSIEADSENRVRSIDDVRFVSIQGEQWDEYQKRKRKTRPCYEFNRLRQHIRQVTGDQRQNRPQIKLRAVEQSDKDTADIMQGLIRNIESISNADKAYDTAFEWAVTGGYGVWRLKTEYNNNDSFEQDIKIQEITNPFSVYFDPSAQEFDRRDAHYAFVITKMGKEEFKQKYPNDELIDYTGANYDIQHWIDDASVTLCEYWYKQYEDKNLLLLSNGNTVYDDEIPDRSVLEANGITVIKERKVEVPSVKMAMLTGEGVIQEADWAGRFIPIVPVYGDIIDIDGEYHYSGMVRFGKDAQRVYNYHRTTMIETIANAPKVPYLVTPEQIKGFEGLWKSANAENMPFLPYNPDPRAGGMPQRSGGVEIPQALITASQYDAEDIKAVTGQFDASMGANGNETSGRAILARQREGDTATYSYIDNLSRAIRYTGEILVDLIPKIYDTERVVRILGIDGGEKWVEINKIQIDQMSGQEIITNDITGGKYDVSVNVGASYNTQRQEASEALLEMMGNPMLAPVVADLLAKNLDIPNSDELEKRLRKIGIKSGVIEATEEEMKEGGDQVMQGMHQQFEEQITMMQQQAEQAMSQLTFKIDEQKSQLEQAQTMILQEKLNKDNEKAKLLIEREKLRLDFQRAETDRMKVENDSMRIKLDAEFKNAQLIANQSMHDDEMDVEMATSGQAETSMGQQDLIINPNDLARYD
tara:strand:+ start:3871 stop:6021 length:2151 start_codon:yes stop_codon:yes gene_type:complete